jgi:hypothetical protein
LRKFREVFTPKELLCKRFGIGLARQLSPSWLLIVANRPTAAQSLAAASAASWQRSLSDVHSGQAVRLGLIHRGRTEGRWVEASSPQPDSTVIALASPTGVERRVAFTVGRYAMGARAGDPSRRDHRWRHRLRP